MHATSPATTCRTNNPRFTLPPRLASPAPQALIVRGKALRLKECSGLGIERPYVERQHLDVADRGLGAHGGHERGADAAAGMRGAHADQIDVDHLASRPPRRPRAMNHA